MEVDSTTHPYRFLCSSDWYRNSNTTDGSKRTNVTPMLADSNPVIVYKPDLVSNQILSCAIACYTYRVLRDRFAGKGR